MCVDETETITFLILILLEFLVAGNPFGAIFR